MANLKDIAATLAILGSVSFMATGCKKDSSEVPAGDDAAAEKSCGGDKAEGSCGGDKAEGSCGGDKAEGEGSCGGEHAEGEGSCGGDKAAEGGEEADPGA